MSTEYGILCQREDEKIIVKRINNYLKTCDYRKLYKKEEDSDSTFDYEYHYCQFLHELWYFDLSPNEDRKGNCRFSNKNAEWILFVNKMNVDENTKKVNGEVDVFFEGLLKAVEFPTVVLHEYKETEDRIGFE